MAHRSPYRREEEHAAWRFGRFSPWRLIFADHYKRPMSWAEKRQLRFRASFFYIAGVVTVLLVQTALGKYGLCPRP